MRLGTGFQAVSVEHRPDAHATSAPRERSALRTILNVCDRVLDSLAGSLVGGQQGAGFFEEIAQNRGCYSQKLLARIAQQGSLQNVREIPEDIRKFFITAFDVSPEHHLLIQAAFQKYTDNAVSKTVNLPSEATVEDVRTIYMRAYKLKCKGITVYRYGSKEDQILSFEYRKDVGRKSSSGVITVGSEYSGGCAVGSCHF